MVDTSFLITLFLIFAGAMLGSYLRGSQKDRCLSDFDRYHVTVEKKNGRIIWGLMRLTATGMELEYRTDVQDQAHIETSYLLYRSEYKDLHGIYRYVDELTPEDQRRRERELRKSFHPGPARILARRTRNFFSRATDSLAEAMPLITGQAKKPAGQYISATEEKYLQSLGKNIIGYVGTSYDPLLEEYVGAKVVMEVAEGGTIYEYVGILKEYSADFLEVLDVFYPQIRSINMASAEEREALERDIKIAFEGSSFRIQNLSNYPLLLHKIRCQDREGEVNAVIGPGDEIELQTLALTEARTAEKEDLSVFFEGLSEEEEDKLEGTQGTAQAADLLCVLEGLAGDESARKDVQFDFKIIRVLDMIVPRDHALIRHKAERYDPNQVFGEIGLNWRLSPQEENLEALYRKALKKNPGDVNSLVGLSKLLVQRARFEEAAQLLEAALQHRAELVDGGRLVELQWQWVKRKLTAEQRIMRGG